ncbi:hypothetical protein PPERSA_00388 [Pseudocohnilembus persalinus]|uniref:Uncharacterized protein n=1 Tax=Pseudocohnilembus persalinus TaxID=266149 RepID=A0A0V0QY12_PSEPJ|nr:hypothetical protein PPERSA_00388 [Pseudocohnilembus persalinus]|eukprot:KRX07231.1 hypothetical protein PPERSA_00388 [Pseudocohnilembus persalinus]
MDKNNKLIKQSLGLGCAALSGFLLYKLQQKYWKKQSQQKIEKSKSQGQNLYEQMIKQTEKKKKETIDIGELEKQQQKPFEVEEEQQKKQSGENDEQLKKLEIGSIVDDEKLYQYLEDLHQNLFQTYYTLTYFEGLLKNTLNANFDLKNTVLGVVQGQLVIKVLTKDIDFQNSKRVKINQKRARNQLINVENFLKGAVQKTNQQHGLNTEEEERNFYANILKKANQVCQKNYMQQSNCEEKIRNIIKQIQEELVNVISGKQATINYQVPENLTPENFLKITKEISMETCYRVQEVFRNNAQELIHLHGEIQIADTKVQKLIQSIDNYDIKKSVYEKYGLLSEEDKNMEQSQLIEKMNQIMIKANQQFGEKDKQFKIDAKKLDQRFSFAYESCVYHPNNTKIVKEIFGDI